MRVGGVGVGTKEVMLVVKNKIIVVALKAAVKKHGLECASTKCAQLAFSWEKKYMESKQKFIFLFRIVLC